MIIPTKQLLKPRQNPLIPPVDTILLATLYVSVTIDDDDDNDDDLFDCIFVFIISNGYTKLVPNNKIIIVNVYYI